MEWAFDVLDQLTAPMKAMEMGTSKLEAQLKRTSGELGNFDKNLGHNKQSAGETGEAHSMLGSILEADFWIEAGHKVAEYTEKIIDLGVELFKMGAEASDMNKTQVAGLSILLGNKEAGEAMKETLDQMSKSSGVAESVFFAQFQQLAPFTKQFGKKASEDVMSAIADVNLGFGQSAGQAVLNVIQGSVSMGGMNSRLLRQLKETGVTTIPEFERALATARGVTLQQAQALLKAGKVTPADTANIILDLVSKNVDGGKPLGTKQAELASTTVSGQLNKLKVLWDQLLEGQAMEPAINALKKIGAFLDPTTAQGKKFGETIGKAFDLMASAIKFGVDNFDVFVGAIDVAFAAVSTFGDGIKWWGELLGSAAYQIVTGYTSAFQSIVNFGSSITAGLEAAWTWLASIPARAEAAGKALIDGLISGITGGMGRAVGAIEGLGSNMIAAIRKKFDTHSPSKVMEEIGINVTAGFAQGVERPMSPKIGGMTDIMLPSPKFSGGLGGGGRSVTVNVSTNVTGGTTSSADDISEAIATKVRAEIVRFMESDSIEN